MERRKSISIAALALCITIMLCANSIPVLANEELIAAGPYSLRLDSYGVIMDQSGSILGWSARLTGTVQGDFKAYFDDYDYVIWCFHYSVDSVNLRFTWYRDPLGLTGRTGQTFSEIDLIPMHGCHDWLDGQYVDSATWRLNTEFDEGPLYASLSLNVRWRGLFDIGRTGTLTGKFKGAIPIPDTGYLFVPTGGFSYGVNVRGTATIEYIGHP